MFRFKSNILSRNLLKIIKNYYTHTKKKQKKNNNCRAAWRAEPTALLIAASIDALGMFLLLHCSSRLAKFIFRSGLDPPSAYKKYIQNI